MNLPSTCTIVYILSIVLCFFLAMAVQLKIDKEDFTKKNLQEAIVFSLIPFLNTIMVFALVGYAVIELLSKDKGDVLIKANKPTPD